MGRTIITTTNLSSLIGQTIKISGSDCCWTVMGSVSAADSTVRDVTVTQENCYYYYGGILSESLPEIVEIF